MHIDDYCRLSDGGLIPKDGLQHFMRQNILTDHPVMKQQLDMLDRAGAAATPLMILGEKGSGKDMIAQYAHLVSSRSSAPFLKINCSYLADERIRMELFGTGTSRGDSLLKHAVGGTLYIENADLLSSQTQYRLIDYITAEDKSSQSTRYIVSLNHNSPADCGTALIDPFIFYFNSMIFEVTPLRQRPEDILLLSLQQLSKINEEYHIERLFSPNVMTAMLSYEWPGNIRQLINAVDRMAFFCDTRLIDSVSFFQNSLSSSQKFDLENPKPTQLPKTKSLKEIALEYEVMVINQYIEEYGSLRKAAVALKTSPSVLSSKLTKYYASTASKE